jgi:nucleotide-binding universal stress UspA family protein
LKSRLSRILVAVDGSNFSLNAAEYAISLAKSTDADLFVVNVLDISSIFRILPADTKKQLIRIGRQEANRMFDDVLDMSKKHDVSIKTEVIESSISAADAIIKYAKDKEIDLIVIGTKGRSGMKKALLGSVASKVMTYSPCPVLVVR